jgi:hypothetical protein
MIAAELGKLSELLKSGALSEEEFKAAKAKVLGPWIVVLFDNQNSKESSAVNSYMVVAKFKEGVSQEDIRELVPAEQAQAKLLEEKGAIGTIKIAMPKRTVFIEAFGDDETQVNSNIESLPRSKLWEWEIFATTPPAGAPS